MIKLHLISVDKQRMLHEFKQLKIDYNFYISRVTIVSLRVLEISVLNAEITSNQYFYKMVTSSIKSLSVSIFTEVHRTTTVQFIP